MAAISRGIDVSSYQGRQDWAALARGGITFVQVKASEGEHTRDDHYRMHMDGILTVPSLLPMGYHYGWPNQDAHREADNYLGAVNDDADKTPAYSHALDLERAKNSKNYAGASDKEIRTYAEAWIDRVRAAHPHQRVICYTSKDDIAKGHYPRNSDGLWYPAYPAGAMTYTQAQNRARPAPSGIKALFWQFTSTPLDRSICYLTPAALRTWAGGPQEDDPMAGMTPQQIYSAVWRTDAVPAPADSPKTNPQWTAESVLRDLQVRTRALQAAQAAQSATIGELARALAARDDTVDVDGLVARIEQAIDGIRVHLTTDAEPDAPAPAAS